MNIVDSLEKKQWLRLGQVTYGDVLRFKEHNPRKIERYPNSLGFGNRGTCESTHWTKRVFMLADIWNAARRTVIVVDVSSGKAWEVDHHEEVQVVDCELVLT